MLVNFFDRNDTPICSKVFCTEEDARAWAYAVLQNSDKYASADFWQDGLFRGTMIKGANA